MFLSSEERQAKVEELVREAWLNIRREAHSDPERAIVLYNRALEFEPDHMSALMGRFQALMKVGKIEQAKRDVNRLLQLDPADHDLVLMSTVFEGEERLQFLSEAIDRMPEDSIFRQEILKELGPNSRE